KAIELLRGQPAILPWVSRLVAPNGIGSILRSGLNVNLHQYLYSLLKSERNRVPNHKASSHSLNWRLLLSMRGWFPDWNHKTFPHHQCVKSPLSSLSENLVSQHK